jgi:hypothetical protein
MEPGQEPRPHRRFGLGDGLILMAALAFTLATLRGMGWFARFPTRIASWWEISLELLRQRSWTQPFESRGQVASLLAAQILEEIFVGLLSSVLLGLTLVQPLLRMRRPRPPFREVIRQSGLAACLGWVIGTLIAVNLSLDLGVDPRYGVLLASALMLLWPLLGVFPWRMEPSWIDRLGRAVGWGWLIATVAAVAAAYFYS